MHLINFSFYLSIIYLVIRFIDCFYLAFPYLGDEHGFANDLNYFIENGYSNSVIHGISIPFTLISYFFFILTDNPSMSLRITGTLFTILLILYMMYRLKITRQNFKIFFFHLFLLIGTTGGTLYGTNDSIFLCSYIILLFELFIVNQTDRLHYFIIFFSSLLFIISRPVVIIYSGIFFIGYALFKIVCQDLIFSRPRDFTKLLYSIVLSLIFVGMLNYPRFAIGQYELSYSNKIQVIEKTDGITWAEWAYYSQIVGNKNQLGFFAPFVDRKEVIEYKNLHGESSLPQTFPEYLVHDIPFVVLSCIRAIIEIVIISVRYVGIYLWLLPFYFYIKYKNRSFDIYFFMACIIIVGIFVWATIIPTLIQHRWLYPFYVMLLVTIINEKSFNFFKYHVINLILLDTITLWALWKWKLFIFL